MVDKNVCMGRAISIKKKGEIMSEESRKETVKACPAKAEKSPAADYTNPCKCDYAYGDSVVPMGEWVTYSDNSVKTYNAELKVDDEKYRPEYVGSAKVASVKAKLEEPIRLPPRGIISIDCGFSINLSKELRVTFKGGGVYKAKGLGVIAEEYENTPMKLVVINWGREILQIDDGSIFAEMSLEKVNRIDWVNWVTK